MKFWEYLSLFLAYKESKNLVWYLFKSKAHSQITAVDSGSGLGFKWEKKAFQRRSRVVSILAIFFYSYIFKYTQDTTFVLAFS